MNEFIEVNISDIMQTSNPSRVTVNRQGITELANSIRECGLIHVPAVCASKTLGKWDVLAGNRRIAALKEIGRVKTYVQVFNRDPEGLSDNFKTKLNFHENYISEKPSMLDAGLKFIELKNSGHNLTEIANICATTEQKVQKAMACFEIIKPFYLEKAVPFDRNKNQDGLLTHEKLLAVVNAAKSIGLSKKQIDECCEAGRVKGIHAVDIIKIARRMKTGMSRIDATEDLLTERKKYIQKAVNFSFHKKKLEAFRDKRGDQPVSAVVVEALKTWDVATLKEFTATIHVPKKVL